MENNTEKKSKQELINSAKKIVIKIGSSTLTSKDGKVDTEFLTNLRDQVKELIDMDKKVVIVSSGARMAGVSSINKWSRKEDINYKQALCAIGQVELMGEYRRIFLQENLHVAQILLTKDDLKDQKRNLNIRNTLFTLIDEGVIPVINENDTVSVEEIKIGDNDMLSAHVSVLWGADLDILLSDIDGIYDKNPHQFEDAVLFDDINDIVSFESKISIGEKGSFGTGGMQTKIDAAKKVTKYGCNLVITNGKHKDAIINIFKGTSNYTLVRGL